MAISMGDARRRKERTYLELSGDGGRARMVVLAAEVGGRWSVETANFLANLAKAKALDSPMFCRAGSGLHQEVERSSGPFNSARVLCFSVGPPFSAGSRVISK